MCGESRTHGVNGGKIWRLYQRITYPYSSLAGKMGILVMVEKIVCGYIAVALIMSLLLVLLNKKTLSKMNNWKIFLVFVLSPLLVIREILYNLKNKGLRK